MKLYPNIAAAVADPTSNIARVVHKYETVTKPSYDSAVATLMDEGLTREEAWHKLLFAK